MRRNRQAAPTAQSSQFVLSQSIPLLTIPLHTKPTPLFDAGDLPSKCNTISSHVCDVLLEKHFTRINETEVFFFYAGSTIVPTK
jgi:hypothetical protein